MKNRVPFCLILSLLAVASCGNLPQEKAILSGIKAPVFRPVDYTPEPGADFRQALNAAIEKCSSEGGGRVVVPAGRHECDGPVVLRSNVELHLEKDAEIAFSSSPEAYLPAVRTFFEGTELYNYSPLVYAVGQENIAITGEGVLNGQASGGFAQFRPQRSAQQDSLRQMGIDGVPVEKRCFGARSILPPNMIQPISCRNILIEGVTILDSIGAYRVRKRIPGRFAFTTATRTRGLNSTRRPICFLLSARQTIFIRRFVLKTCLTQTYSSFPTSPRTIRARIANISFRRG